MGNENLKDYDSEKENEDSIRYPKRMKDIKEIKGKVNKETIT